jgi:hypothetical protein
MEHTPGPWTVEGTQIYAPWGDKRRVIAKTGQTYAWGDGYAMAEADARLIAAAPDLLAALQEGLRERPSKPGVIAEYWDWMDMARAAIAKAIGEKEKSAPAPSVRKGAQD